MFLFRKKSDLIFLVSGLDRVGILPESQDQCRSLLRYQTHFTLESWIYPISVAACAVE